MKYEIALSFAGEDRNYVKEVASLLQRRGVSIFYDEYEKANLWGKDLYQHLSKVYSETARFTIIFISKNYEQKLWTKHELRNAQARAFKNSEEYILPARFDETELPGLLPTIGYLDLRILHPNEFVEIVIEKLLSNITIDFKHKAVTNTNYTIEQRVLLTIDDSYGNTMFFNLNEYNSFDRILDDLFTYYISDKVKPFSYGSEWVLLGEPFSMRVLAPVEWVLKYNKPIHSFANTWTSKIELNLIGVFPGAHLRISYLKRDKFTKVYGVLTNNEQLANILNTEAKAIAIVNKEQFREVGSVSQDEIEVFNYKMVYIDWLSAVDSNFLIDTGKDLDKRIIEWSNRR
jgi:hypothetical protein